MAQIPHSALRTDLGVTGRHDFPAIWGGADESTAADEVTDAAPLIPAAASGSGPVEGGKVEVASGGLSTLNPQLSTASEAQLREATRRARLVEELGMLMQGPPARSLNQVAKLLGESAATLCRYRRAWESGGFAALVPGQSPGRTPKFSLTDDEARALRWLRLQKGSFALAIEEFVRHPQCRPETRAQICEERDRAARERREPNWPQSLRRAGQVSVEEEAVFRGKKHFGEIEHCERRGLFFFDEAGERQLLAPNTIWESDDMSSNEPFSWLDPETGEPRIGRQTLCTLDVFSCFWLGASPIGRERDAYRVEDIADHVRELVAAHGLPLIWRLERGVWENDFIHGAKAGTGPDGEELRWGGLDALFKIDHTWKSRGKGTIESSFNLLQSLMAHESTSIGRSRGEFEAQGRDYLRASGGDLTAARKFWDMGTFADAFRAGMERFNLRPKKRRAFGRELVVPSDLYRAATRRECPPDQLWRFLPVKRTATVRQGHIEVCVNHYPLPFRFVVNGVEDTYLEHGHAVLVAFHPGHPEQGCHVFNAETGTRNRDGLRFGEPLLVAPLAEDAPQIHLGKDERELVRRKNANAAVRSEFRALRTAGQIAPRTSTARDGWGQSIRRESGTAPAPGMAARRDAAQPSRSTRPPEFDEDAELERIARKEREAIERGDLLAT